MSDIPKQYCPYCGKELTMRWDPEKVNWNYLDALNNRVHVDLCTGENDESDNLRN